MFGIGSTELLVILVVALIVLGPKTLASLSKTVGKAVGEFRRVSTDFQRTLNAEAAQEVLARGRHHRVAVADVELATAIRVRHGLRTPDALQAASCLQLGRDHLLLTGDATFQRVQGLNVSLIT